MKCLRAIGGLSALAFVLSTTVWGQAATPATLSSETAAEAGAAATSGSQARPDDGEIGVAATLAPGDQILLTVTDAPELTSQAQLDVAGTVNLPQVGRLALAGDTVAQAESEIAARLRAGYLLRPQVALRVVRYAGVPVTLAGAIAHPGVYSIRGDDRLVTLLARAGGATPSAGATVYITRGAAQAASAGAAVPATATAAEPAETLSFPLADLESRPDVAPLHLHPHDLVQVIPGESVYVGGEVGHAGAFPIPTSGLSLLQALTLAGGPTANGARARVRVWHTDRNGERRLRLVNTQAILAGRAPDPALTARDLVYVPTSHAHSGFTRGLDTALNTGSAILTGLIVFH